MEYAENILIDFQEREWKKSTQVFHTNRTNLSPFTKDFRVRETTY